MCMCAMVGRGLFNRPVKTGSDEKIRPYSGQRKNKKKYISIDKKVYSIGLGS